QTLWFERPGQSKIGQPPIDNGNIQHGPFLANEACRQSGCQRRWGMEKGWLFPKTRKSQPPGQSRRSGVVRSLRIRMHSATQLAEPWGQTPPYTHRTYWDWRVRD